MARPWGVDCGDPGAPRPATTGKALLHGGSVQGSPKVTLASSGWWELPLLQSLLSCTVPPQTKFIWQHSPMWIFSCKRMENHWPILNPSFYRENWGREKHGQGFPSWKTTVHRQEWPNVWAQWIVWKSSIQIQQADGFLLKETLEFSFKGDYQ